MLQYILKRSDANILPAVKNQTLPINETSVCVCTVCICTVCMRVVLRITIRNVDLFFRDNLYVRREKRRIT